MSKKQNHVERKHPNFVKDCILCEARRNGEGLSSPDINVIINDEIPIKDKGPGQL